MKKIIVAVAATLMLAGCTTAERTAVGGAAVGAAVGGIATGTGTGALVGAAIGGTAGYLVGRAAQSRPGYCEVVDRRSGRVVEVYRADAYGNC